MRRLPYAAAIFSNHPTPVWSPPSSVVAWYDASDSSTLTLDGFGRVSQWKDKTANAKHLSQSTSGKRPTYVASGSHGYPCLSFNVLNPDFLSVSDLTLGKFTFIIVCRIPDSDRIIYSHGTVVGSCSFFYAYSTNASYVARAGATTSKGAASTTWASDDTWHRLRQEYGGTNTTHNFYLGDTEMTSTNPNTDNPGTSTLTDVFRLGIFLDGVSSPFKGFISELFFFSDVLSASDLNSVNAHIAFKWGVTS